MKYLGHVVLAQNCTTTSCTVVLIAKDIMEDQDSNDIKEWAGLSIAECVRL